MEIASVAGLFLAIFTIGMGRFVLGMLTTGGQADPALSKPVAVAVAAAPPGPPA